MEVESADKTNSGFLRWSLVLCAQLYAWTWKNFRGTLGFWKPWADIIGIPSTPQAHSRCHPGWTQSVGELFGMIYKVVPEGDTITEESPLTGFRERCYSPCLRCNVRPFGRVQRYFSTIISHMSVITMRRRHFLSAAPLTPDSFFVQRQRLTQRL